MITIDITINDSGKVTDVIMDGHANHGEYGHDIVCAGASAVLFGSVNAILGLTLRNQTLTMRMMEVIFILEV